MAAKAVSDPAAAGLAGVLGAGVADFKRASGADMVSLFLYDEASRRYFAPFAVGQPEASLLDSLADMREQLGRYLADDEQGKVPDDLGFTQYGSTVWLTAMRRTLVARDAATEIASSFVRRHGVVATFGLPLIAGGRMLGLVYLNYTARGRIPDDRALADLERLAEEAAAVVHAALAGAQPAALEGVSRLAA